VGIGAAEALGEDVVDPCTLDHGAHGSTRNDPGSLRRRLQKHLTAPEMPEGYVRDRHSVERHGKNILARLIVALADRLGHLVRLAEAHADVTGFVADDDESTEAEATSALDDFRNAIDVDDALLEPFFVDLERFEWHVVDLPVRTSIRPCARHRRARG